jgi:DNA polymerase I-like protein with 3'-5' exonuclease and polymerase domains
VIRTNDSKQMALDLLEPVRVWHAPAHWTVPSSLPELSGLVALDFETKDPGISRGMGSSWAFRDEGFICGAAIATDTESFYLPINHAAGNMDAMLFWPWLRKQAAKEEVTFVMANSIYDLGWLRRHNITPRNAPIDVQAMAFLLDEHRRSYSLDNLGREYLQEGKLSSSLVDDAKAHHIDKPMANMDKMPAWMVAPYAIQDARLTQRLFYILWEKIVEEDLEEVFTLERQSALVAVDMRMRGIRIDEARVERLRTKYTALRDAALQSVFEKTDVRATAFDNEALARALRVENPSLDFEKTALGKDSIRRDFVESLGTPVSRAIADARKYEKALGTFIDGYLTKYVVRGRLHGELHPTRRADEDAEGGTTSGRWASSNPNLQNIPARDPELGPDIRGCFLPEEGEQWLKLDWASQEPRLTVHFALLARQRGAREMAQRFRDNPHTDLHGECAALMDVTRPKAKTINLGLAYGMQGAKLCHTLGLPTEMVKSKTGTMIEVAGKEGQRLLDLHFEKVPFMRGTYMLAKQRAEKRGYVKTISGRRIRFEKIDNRYWRTHKALNGIIQGSAADQMKYALAQFLREGIPAALTVHDEADRSIPLGEEGERIRKRMVEIMERIVPLEVPMIAESLTGANWGECK